MENKYGLPEDHLFTYDKIIALLEECMGKTLGEVDKNHVFDKTKTNPKITGIAGDVVEQSILGYKPDSDQRPDILIDDVPTEVKTTGIRYSKKKGQEGTYEAKEPMSITAVSPRTIVNEEFYGSHFYEKLAHMLLVYYLYDSNVTVEAKDYARFFLKSYELHEFNDEDTDRLQCDWEIVRDFIREIQNNYSNPESQYPRISSELRDRLMYVDTAPKWPNSPRFRLKRSVVTSIVRNHFDKKLEVLPDKIDNFIEFDKKLHDITKLYKGKTVEELVKYFNVNYTDINKLNKAIAEQIIIKMFGGKSKKINQIELFEKVGIIAKTICLSSKGGRTEDMKLFSIDFNEWTSDIKFEDSFCYDYFMNHQFLCIVFEEKDNNQSFKDNKFLGFKRISFSNEFIDGTVQTVWNRIRDLVINKKLTETIVTNKEGSPIINKTGLVSTALNFPKSSEYDVFVRGSGIDSTKKPLSLNGINMYEQCLWVKGKYIVDELKNRQYL
jgi:type II restriction endonuclease, mutH